ncbi:DSBA family oxidoreductase [Sphaerulina musiva SO2202]|uniref:Glutathione S-transferase kappa n=1 Tax=Sphaerulina musiva (strain SO2202) TaxID=692275 RepID=N1QIH6_SPHMS|nr:DSBA family oxidoreductase [Sphaerulina musiva SO2202]EMF12234.1 DSBA family oxidoreductase [Sphaerulina musiva SO2202]
MSTNTGNGGRIDLYVDCNSPWSYFAYLYLRRNRPALSQHNISVEIHPIFLGGINVGSGNKPPWTLPAKARLSKLELPRGMQYFGLPPNAMKTPPFFPIMSILPMRAMLVAKDQCEYDRYEDAFGGLWEALWGIGGENRDVSRVDVLAEVLRKYFGEGEVELIMKGAVDAKYKKLLVDETARLVDQGAFGAPWLLVTNADGREESFFGSDRWHFIYQFLGVPFQDITILPPPGKDGAKL